ncbi:hypothetical protein QBC39DRAFT_353944 [Podospora conica]|nr:hypothetical protein QBC39DRAFT_353944 [Schizothecium conicum]
MPNMTCFVPSLPAGNFFQISVHNWSIPNISQIAQSYSEHTDDLKFEVRVLVDGCLAVTSTFDREFYGPHLINTTLAFTKNGELGRLRFPHFHNELLFQDHWNPGDDIGRIKVVISEGFPRDSQSVPFERVKNVVAFSFQHAPLGILESNGIAWPNQAMWRRPALAPVIPVPTYRPNEGASSHAHSPRRKPNKKGIKAQATPISYPAGTAYQAKMAPSFHGGQPFPMPYMTRTVPGASASLPLQDSSVDPSAYLQWVSQFPGGQLGDEERECSKACCKKDTPTYFANVGELEQTFWTNPASNRRMNLPSDEVMTDYTPPSPNVMHISGPSLEDNPASLRVPANSPTDGSDEVLHPVPFSLSSSFPICSQMATPLAHSLLNQPVSLPLQAHNIPLPSSEVKSRKENRHFSFQGPPNGLPSYLASTHSTPNLSNDMRKFSQPLLGTMSHLGNSMMSSVPALSSSLGPHGHAESPQQFFSGNSGTPITGGFSSSFINRATAVHETSCSPSKVIEEIMGRDGDGSPPAGGSTQHGHSAMSTMKRKFMTPVLAGTINEEDGPRQLGSTQLGPSILGGEYRIET